MSGTRTDSAREPLLRLEHCLRDLTALTALPSMCIGRSPEESIELVLDALPTALACELVCVAMPGSPGIERTKLRGKPAPPTVVDTVHALIENQGRDDGVLDADGLALRYVMADVPLRADVGRLLVGRTGPFADDTDRVLVGAAANLVGSALENANVLETARRKDEFLAMLGHELRNPLAPIMTALELLARNPSATRERTVIDRNMRHLARLVDDLLDVSRVTRGHIELRDERVPLASILDRAAELSSPLIARQRHTLTIAEVGDAAVRGDPVRLAQIFGNLLTNAAKFTPAGGRIDVDVRRSGRWVHVSVRDSGRGMTPEQTRLIFEPFVQLDRRADALAGGLGLGLAIVKNLVDRHGGRVRVASAGPGQGTTFHVDLPAADGADVETAPTLVHAPTSRRGVRLLVVDDNMDITDLLTEALRVEGFETVAANDAHAALETWQGFAPHAAVIDVGLPDMDGYSLARALRKQYGGSPTLIAATGYAERRDRLAAAEAGFDCHFVKPVSIEELVATLDQRVVGRVGAGA